MDIINFILLYWRGDNQYVGSSDIRKMTAIFLVSKIHRLSGIPPLNLNKSWMTAVICGSDHVTDELFAWSGGGDRVLNLVLSPAREGGGRFKVSEQAGPKSFSTPNLNNNWMTAMIGWSRHVTDWTTIWLVRRRILDLVRERHCAGSEGFGGSWFSIHLVLDIY